MSPSSVENVVRRGVKTALAALALSCAVACPMQSNAADAAITLTVENDLVTGSDNNYTNGIGLSWVSKELNTYESESFVRKWAQLWAFLPFVADEGYETYASWSLAQEMHTPDDIEDPSPPEDDQPYAGILYVDSLLYARKERWTHAWELKVGVVGPASQAENVQKDFHELVGGDEPMGWDTQLPDEPVINVSYTVAHLLAEGSAGESAKWRIVPVASVGLGTYFTGVGVGTYAEVGWNLLPTLGGTALREGLNAASTVGVGPVEGWSVAFFGGFAGYGVAHYLPLDGTVFKDSRSVGSEPFIGMGSAGMSVRHGRFVLGLSATFYTQTFDTQRKNPEFGTLSASWYFK
jgi:lipid A 3-O-deacylase